MARELAGGMEGAGGDPSSPVTSKAQVAIDLFLQGVQAKRARRSTENSDHAAGRVYEDEPVLLTGAQLVARREREAREAYRCATGREPSPTSESPAPSTLTSERASVASRGSASPAFQRPRTLDALAASWPGEQKTSRWDAGGRSSGGWGVSTPPSSGSSAVRGGGSWGEERIPSRPDERARSSSSGVAYPSAPPSTAPVPARSTYHDRGGVCDGGSGRHPSAAAPRYVPAAPARRDVTWGELWSDLGTPPAPSLPAQYQGVRELARDPEVRRHPDAWLFYQQGRLLAEVEDDCPYTGTFERYYPTYNAMTDRQLRGYITWRTQLRRGIVTKTSTSFAFVYIYELLNGIGVAGPEDAYRRLRRFWDDYRDLEPAADRYLRSWLRDYVVYHDLPRALIADDPALSKELILDEALVMLLGGAGGAEIARGTGGVGAGGNGGIIGGAGRAPTPDERFSALATLSSYRMRSSRFYKEYPADVQAVVLGVFDRLAGYYRTGKRKHDLFETLFGESCALPYEMFRACVFYEERPHPDGTYELDAVNRYVCANGRWTCERYQGNRRESTKLGRILKEIDARMRARYGYAHPLREEKTPKYLLAFIEREIDARLAWKAAHAPRIIEIDRSKLGGIRGDAATVREELLVDEERDEGAGEGVRVAARAGGRAAVPMAEAGLVGDSTRASETAAGPMPAPGVEPAPLVDPAIAPSPAPTPPVSVLAGGTDSGDASAARVAPAGVPVPAGAPCGLTAQELAFVRGLLAGDAGLPPGPLGSVDMLVDAVNEKLFDELGDTAVEFGADGPAVIEDYRDDVRGIVGA